ncbi:MAG: S8 family peptidase [Elusimicrobiota bacterium]|nr:MAG: S8 family peptidase [Elusimicrobiota bacterium]
MVRVFTKAGLLALSLLAVSTSAYAERRIVVFQPSVAKAQRVALAQAAGGRVVRELPLINAVVVELGQLSVAEGRLRALAEVKRVDPDPKINWLQAADARGVDFAAPSAAGILKNIEALKARAKQEAPSEPEPSAPGQETPWGIKRVQAPAAWATTRGQGVKLAVIDTGIDMTHPELSGILKGGWNAISTSTTFNDDNGHGTHCAGTIAAKDDAAGVVGVAPEIDLYGVKVLDEGGSGTFDDVIAGMLWAVENKMEIASMSLGAGRGNPALADAVEVMRKAGVILIAAAGNSGGSVGFPAAYPGAIAVAASDSADKLAGFSSRGPSVAVIAPGVNVKSTYMGGGYDTLSGTSMATPHVAGLAALYVATHKGATPEQARAALTAASAKLPNVPDIGQGAGLPTAPALVR